MRPEVAAVSLTWKDASTAVRARASDPVPDPVWEQLRAQGGRGLLELHTCARSLWLVSGEPPHWLGPLVQAHVAGRTGVSPEVRVGEDAVAFVLRVAVGLESYVQGEADIGRQVAHAFAEARAAGRTDAVLHVVEQAASALVAEGLSTGWVRAGRGLGQLAVAWLARQGADRSRPVGVVGAGAIGRRVEASLVRAGWAPPVIYNRSPGANTAPISAIVPDAHDAWVVCTAAPRAWLSLDGARFVVDLGVPSQVEGPAMGLDQLLAGEGGALDPVDAAAARTAVDREVVAVAERLRSIRRRRALAHATELRDRFLAGDLPDLLAQGLDGLPPAHRRRVVRAAEAAIRRYNHQVVAWLREEMGEIE